MEQTKVTDVNRDGFYRAMYPQQRDSQAHLLQIDKYLSKQFVIVDSCGWHYQQCWPTINIVKLELMTSASQFKLDETKFDKLFSTKWPDIDVSGCVLVFDRAPMLKYKTVEEIVSSVSSAADQYTADVVWLRIDHVFVDDPRLTDRFTTLSMLQLPGYVVSLFVYNNMYVEAMYKRKVT